MKNHPNTFLDKEIVNIPSDGSLMELLETSLSKLEWKQEQ